MSLFIKKLEASWRQNKTMLCVGLDPDIDKLPAHLKSQDQPLFNFNRQIIDSTYDLVCAYKLQIAYYSAYGAENELQATIQYINENYPHLPVILDSKRGDIGSTSEMYAKEAFERYKADAVTVNPYMGGDALSPFLKWQDKGVIILCKTSNEGSRDMQDLLVNGSPIYEHVARLAAENWNANKNVMLVLGATQPQALKKVRQIVGDMPLLVPGVGAQGGDVELVIKNGADSKGHGLVINSSRSIIYASGGLDFAQASRKASQDLCRQMVLI